MWYGIGAMKKQIILLFAAALLLTALLPGCSRSKPEPTPEPIATSPPMPTEDPHIGETEVLDGMGGTMWVPEAPNLTPFGLEPTNFTVTDQIPSYTGQEDLTMRRGIDVSDHQMEIDWQRVADYGIDFAIIRCGWRSYDNGTINEDSRFRENIQGALDAGLDVGVYFFSQALNIVEAAEEAVYTLHLIEGYDVTLPVFYDWEPMPYNSSRSANVDGSVVTACCLEFCQLVEAGGYEPAMYAYNMLAYYTYELKQLEGITLWLADPGTKPIFYFDHTFWQYSYTGAVPGITVDVDLDAMYVHGGVEPVFRYPTPTPSPSEEPSAETTQASEQEPEQGAVG